MTSAEESRGNDTPKGLLAQMSKEQRLIVLHATLKNDFLANGLLMVKSSQARGD
jgi:hypothetical protein